MIFRSLHIGKIHKNKNNSYDTCTYSSVCIIIDVSVIVVFFVLMKNVCLSTLFEPPHGTNKMACAPSEDSDQPGHLPSLIRVFAVRMKKGWALSYPLSSQRILWSDWANAQADLSLRWAHCHFVGFDMRRLISLHYRQRNCWLKNHDVWCFYVGTGDTRIMHLQAISLSVYCLNCINFPST